MKEQSLELKVGRTYRAKKPARAGSMFDVKVNDRTILWIGQYTLQYDGPAVANGRHFPKISIELFRGWAERDVTDELPEGEYASWPPAPRPLTEEEALKADRALNAKKALPTYRDLTHHHDLEQQNRGEL